MTLSIDSFNHLLSIDAPSCLGLRDCHEGDSDADLVSGDYGHVPQAEVAGDLGRASSRHALDGV